MKHFFYLHALVFVVAISVHAYGPGDVLVRTKIGNACASDAECGDSQHCVGERKTNGVVHFASGYCVQFDCSLENPCDVGSKCMELPGVGTTACMAQCATDSHCRNGYHCESGVCLTN